MGRITLAGGSEFETDWCSESGTGRLYLDINMDRVSPQDLPVLFLDPKETAQILYKAGEATRLYQYYTGLVSMEPDVWRRGYTLITLRRQDNGSN